MICVCINIIGVLNEYVHKTYLKNVTPKGANVLFTKKPEGYYVNAHVKMNVNVDDQSNYNIAFQFKDHKKKIRNWQWKIPEDQTDKEILKFGIPKSLFEPYYPVDSVIKKRNRLMREGMFIQQGRYLKPNLLAMVKNYRKYLRPVASSIEKVSDEYNTWRSKVELLMKFCQDIPYGVPPKNFNNKYIGGVFPPPQVFVNKFGDCDSKTVVFCAAASYFNEIESIILIETGHVLAAVKGIPKPYDTYYTYKNAKYILADTAGPGRNDLGMIKDPYKNFKNVIEVKLDQ